MSVVVRLVSLFWSAAISGSVHKEMVKYMLFRVTKRFTRDLSKTVNPRKKPCWSKVRTKRNSRLSMKKHKTLSTEYTLGICAAWKCIHHECKHFLSQAQADARGVLHKARKKFFCQGTVRSEAEERMAKECSAWKRTNVTASTWEWQFLFLLVHCNLLILYSRGHVSTVK